MGSENPENTSSFEGSGLNLVAYVSEGVHLDIYNNDFSSISVNVLLNEKASSSMERLLSIKPVARYSSFVLVATSQCPAS